MQPLSIGYLNTEITHIANPRNNAFSMIGLLNSQVWLRNEGDPYDSLLPVILSQGHITGEIDLF